MEPIKTYEALAPLLSAQLKRGVITNCFLSRADWERELAVGVEARADEGCLLLVRHRPTHDILNFYLQAGAQPQLPVFLRPTVTELVWRQRDAAAVQQAAALFLRQGFVLQTRRLRRQRDAAPVKPADGIVPPQPQQLPAVLQLLEQSFDRRTGCIPDLQTLSQEGVLCALRQDEPVGVLHYRSTKTGTELRHLAVRADHRGQGLGQRLVQAYLQQTENEKSQVWAAWDNVPAGRLYEKFGYRPDGWESVVLLADGKETP